jgi:hypothetical protein
MNNSTKYEDSASSSPSMHEGEPSESLCDRLSRTRDTSQRQLPTDHDYAVSTREYQTDQSSLNLLRLLLTLSSKTTTKNKPIHPRVLTRSLHIRDFASSDHAKASPELATFGYVKLPLRARSKRLLNTVALIRPFETPQVL